MESRERVTPQQPHSHGSRQGIILPSTLQLYAEEHRSLTGAELGGVRPALAEPPSGVHWEGPTSQGQGLRLRPQSKHRTPHTRRATRQAVTDARATPAGDRQHTCSAQWCRRSERQWGRPSRLDGGGLTDGDGKSDEGRSRNSLPIDGDGTRGQRTDGGAVARAISRLQWLVRAVRSWGAQPSRQAEARRAMRGAPTDNAAGPHPSPPCSPANYESGGEEDYSLGLTQP